MENVYPRYKPRLGDRRLRTAIVGAGDIVRSGHLPAYRKAGFPVQGIYDLDPQKARETAALFGIETVYDSLAALLADPEADIVDIAVPASAQKAIVAEAVRHGKHLLCQKPLCDVYRDAVEMVEMAEAAGVTLAVNQQMRWAPLVASCRDLIARRWIGEPHYVHFHEAVDTPLHTWPWLMASGQFDLMYHSIHYLDAIRCLLGMPASVYASLSRYPGDRMRPETRCLVILEYADDRRALLSTNHRLQTDDPYADVRIEGPDGVIKGTIGLSFDYPRGRPDTLEYCSRVHYPDQWFRHTIRDLWIPDAFIGSMNELQLALAERRLPENSGRDNLLTLQLVNAGYLSMREKRAVRPEEIAAMNPDCVIPFAAAIAAP